MPASELLVKRLFLHIDMNDHPASLGMMCGQPIKSPRRFLFYLLELLLQIRSYLNSLLNWVDTDPIDWLKNPSPPKREPASHPVVRGQNIAPCIERPYNRDTYVCTVFDI